MLSILCEEAIVLLTGDATAETEEDLIDVYGADLGADIAKVPHHGSGDRAPEFAGYVSPLVAVISVGAGNPYGHPDPAVGDEWEATGADVYRTDLDGTVTVLADGESLSVETEQ